jgi:hypothetical protein
MTLRIKPGIWVLGMAMVLMGCGSNVTLDNPRSEAVTMVFDGGDEYVVGPGEVKEVSLGEGSHKVTVKGEGGKVYVDTSFTVREGGLVHSGETGYIIWRQLYGLQDDRKSLLNENWIMIDSTRFFADIKIYPSTAIYIEKSWTIGLEEEFPESQALYVTKDYKVESKIFRAAEFVRVYRELAEKNKKAQ